MNAQYHIEKLRALIGGMGYTHMATWMNANRTNYPKFVYHSAAYAVGTIFAIMAIRTVSAAGGDIAEDVLMQVATAVGAVLTCVIIASACRNIHLAFVEPPVIPWAEIAEPKQLTAETAWHPPAIPPDIIVALLPGEEMADFSKRANQKAETATNAIWTAIVQPKGGVAIYRGPNLSPLLFARGAEPFADLLPEGQKWPIGLTYENEKSEEYRHYCDWFGFYFSKWSPEEKLIAAPEQAGRTFLDTMTEKAKAVTVVFSLLLLCIPAFGQGTKIEQVYNEVGTRIMNIPKPGAKVDYYFEEKGKEVHYTRTGDGKSDFAELLQKTKGLVRFKSEGGRFLSVAMDGHVIAKSDAVERVNATPARPNRNAAYLPENNTSDPVRPRGIVPTADEIAGTPRTDSPTEFYFPDSMEMAETADRYQYEIYKASKYTGRAIRPWWELLMFTYWEWFWLICIVTGVSWLFAKTFATEGFWEVHRYAKAILLGVTTFSAAMFIVNIILAAKWAGIGPFGLAIITIILGGISWAILVKINPDFRPARGNEPAARRASRVPTIPSEF